ncbi:hypothetical protein ACF0H5_016987 [Mactra antiquata]
MSRIIFQSILKRSFRKSSPWAPPKISSIGNVNKMCDQAASKSKLSDRLLQIGNFNVYCWSISGIETTVVVKKPSDGFSCCFDMGYACRHNIPCDKVMISHGHMDHISAVPQHIKKRELSSLKPASYYVPPHLVDNLLKVCSGFDGLSENTKGLKDPNIIGVKAGEEINLSRGYFAIPFPTVHRVSSQGYIIYSTHKKLAPKYEGLDPKQIAVCIRNGEDIFDEPEIIPEVAFTGDTTFEVFSQCPQDVFRVKLLIMEATYINNDEGTLEERVSLARKWGHIHLSELYENASMFENVDNILLMHLSDKYSCGYIRTKVFENIPESLKDKIHVSTLAKEHYI